VTVEEHNIIGGWVCRNRVLGKTLPARVEMVGIEDTLRDRPYEALLEKYILGDGAIIKSCKRILLG